MRRVQLLAAMFAFCLLFSAAGNSFATIITDVYTGATTPATGTWHNADRIGDADKFEISQMEVRFVGGDLIVDIYSTYFDNIGALNTALGDLFISTNGWQANGPQPYVNDNYTNGERWEYGLAIDDHLGSGGTLGLYDLNPTGANYRDRFKLSQEAYTSGGTFRHNQEVWVNKSEAGPAIASGSWSLSAGLDFIRFRLNNYSNYFGNATDYGFHWAMTCANDTIEGGIVIPEPSTVVLLGLGLIGIGGYTRIRRKKSV